MALIDEGDKKVDREFILYAQFIRSHADCLLMKMILGMNRLGSFKEGDLFFQGHLDWFSACKSALLNQERHEWLAELHFKRGMVLEAAQKVFPVSHNPAQSYFYAAQEYLELISLNVDSLSWFEVAVRKAIYFFETYHQRRHLEWARFLLYTITSEPVKTLPSSTSWPLIADKYLSFDYEISQDPIYLWKRNQLSLIF